LKKNIKYIAFAVLNVLAGLTLSMNSVTGQDTIATVTNEYEFTRIRWVGQFPDEEKELAKPRLFDRVGRLVFGNKPVHLAKPVAISASRPDEYYVLDQAHGTILSYYKPKNNLSPFSKKWVKFPSLVGICGLPGRKLLFTDSQLDKIYILDGLCCMNPT
jgi:hypothetical protein